MYIWCPQNEEGPATFLEMLFFYSNLYFLIFSLRNSLILSRDGFIITCSPMTLLKFFFYNLFSTSSFPFCRRRPLLLRLWYEPMWQEGADVAEQRVRCLRPGPVGDRRKHRLLALPGGGCHPSPQPEH